MGRKGRHPSAASRPTGKAKKKAARQAGALAPELRQGLALQQRGLIQEAKTVYETYLRKNTGDGDAYHLLGLLHFQARDFENAVTHLGRAAAKLRRNPACFNTLGAAMQSLGRHGDAIEQYSTALHLKPDYADALDNRALALQVLSRHTDALADFDRSARLRPLDAEVWLNRGLSLTALRRLDEALESFDRAIQINPEHAKAHFERGNVYGARKRFEAAREAYDAALRLDPTIATLKGAAMHTRMHLCDWEDFEKRRDDLVTAVREGEKAVGNSWELLSLVDDPECHKIAADSFFVSGSRSGPSLRQRADGSPLRIAYYSADFNDHATSRLMVELIECHDRDRFEVVGVSFVASDATPMAQRMAAAFDEFIDVSRKTDQEVVDWSRARGIDIAIDLKGNTAWARPRLFALGCAPIQVAYLGYPGTFAAGGIAYVLADEVVIPPGSERHFTEQVVRLPQCYQPNDSKRSRVGTTATRETQGLPDAAVVFASMNNPYKILPNVFALWMDILRAVDGSVLWLLSANEATEKNLLAAASAAGIGVERILFAPPLPLEEHMERYALADLVLDTWPYNGHTTGSDALWAGVPVLTRTGHSFASRVGASLLTTLGLPELICESDEAYRDLAITLGKDDERRAALRARVAELRERTPLFRSAPLARYIEAAYRAMIERAEEGLAPCAFHVSESEVVTFDESA